MKRLILAIAAAFLFAVPAAVSAQDTPTSVTFSALNIDCSSSVGTASFTFKIGGTTVATVPFSQGCACNSAPLTVTLNDPATLALVSAPACTLISVTTNDPQGGAYVGWVKADINRAVSGTESICVQDYAGFVAGGGTCGTRDICTGYQFSPGTFSNNLPDGDGDGQANCVDTDDDADSILDSADNCPNVANNDQADSNGDGIGNACEPRAVTVPWLGSTTSPHQVFSGGQLILQGTVRLDPSFSITAASWDAGDGSGPVALSAPFNPRALERTHTYTGSDGTPYTAVLSVTVSNGTITKTLTDNYRVVVRTKTLDVEANMAIDKGLWYLHKKMTLTTTSAGIPSGRWSSNNANAATASAVQAFLINNHREGGNRDEDPYVDNVVRGLVTLFDGLAPHNIGMQTAGDPDTNANGIGLTTTNAAAEPEGYILGQILDAIVATGTPTAVATVGHATAVKGRTYKDIVQDLMDSYNWGQADPGHGTARGGWWYDLNTGSDTSAAQWGAIAGLAAASWGVPVPAFVKSENLLWVDQSSFFDGSNAGIDGRFDYDGGNGSGSIFSQSAAEAPSGLVMMVFGGVPSTSAQYKATERYISRLFYSSNVWDNENHTYGLYAMAKGFRLASPPVTTLDAAGNATPLANFDWYRSEAVGGAPKGAARILIESQQASGRWDANQWVQDDLSTAWSIIILSPTIFQLGPTAVCKAEPATTGVGGVIQFDSVGSMHNDPGGVITGYSWNFGDSTSATGATASHAFTATGTYNVILTVTDNNGLTDTETCQVNIVAGAIPPNANPGPAYNFCAGAPMLLNGSASSDPDGSIVSYEWDWSAPLNFTPADATGVSPNVSAAFTALGPGTYDLALRVTDNNGISNTDFTTVTVKAANDPSCNQPPTFTPPADITVAASSPAGATVTFTPAGNDPEQGAIPAVCTPASGSLFAVGTTAVSCTVTDNQGLSASGSFNVIVTNDAPVVTVPASFTVHVDSAAGATVNYTATATDAQEAVTPTCSPASGSTLPVGAHVVTCSVTDSNGASDSESFTITVVNDAPTISVPGNITVAATSPAGASVSFSATGSDTEQGSIAPVCTPASGSLFAVGTQTVSCTVTDNQGATASGSFTVTVTNDAPVVTVPASFTVHVDSAAGATVTFTASASDAQQGALTPTCTPASGSTLPVGAHVVTCSVTDANGASDSESFTITVVNDAPTFTAPGNIVVNATSAAGAVVTFTANGSDTEQGPIAAVCTPASGSTFAIGTTMVNCTVTDNQGATASGSFTVKVNNNAPTFTPPANITVGTTNPGGTTVTFTANGNDVENGVIAAVCTPASGSNFPIGTTTVNCTVTDAHGASVSGSFTVTVNQLNQAPVCSAAAPSVATLWPVNHKMVNVSILGVSDPDGGAPSVKITKITQDESTNTAGDGNTPIDGGGLNTSVAQLRAERSGNGNGRFYHISFTATDAAGATCTGTVTVSVPKSQGNNGAAVNDGPKFNSVTGAPLP